MHRRLIVVCAGIALVLFGAWHVQVAADCTSVEEYDIVRNECYFECDGQSECDRLSKQVEAELDSRYKDSKFAGGQEKAGDSAASKPADGSFTKATTGSETDGTIYTVQPDANLQPAPSKTDKQLWDLFVKIVGIDNIRKHILSFEVFDDANNDSAASVWRSDDPAKWHMNINAAFKDDRKDLIHTLVHEYGHVVTLSGDQVAAVAGACPRFELSEGCAAAGSYVQAFQSKFWQRYSDDIPANDGENQNEVADFYDSHKADFTSDYAATNVTEDMAESFAFFVLRPRPSGNTVADQKLKFFYNYQELVELRARMRAAIATL